MIRLADYIAKFLADHGIRHVFMVTGGGAMFLNDAIGKEHRLKYVCNHHEQACAMAAEGYARVTGSTGVINVTTGPGGINALNGVFGAWTDSIPMLIISGQVKQETLLATYDLPQLRQLGDQEVDIIRMVKGITKYAEIITDPKSIRFHLEKALFLCRNGRPGPCWLDIPLDIQSHLIDEDSLEGFTSPVPEFENSDLLENQINNLIDLINQAKRPVILAGNGIHCANAVEEFRKVAHKWMLPVVASRTALDLLSSDDPLYCGRSGIDADRGGNFSVQNADLLIVLGSRLGVRQVGFNRDAYAREARIVQVDIDPAELNKPTIKPDISINADLKQFCTVFNFIIENRVISAKEEWVNRCRNYYQNYPGVSKKFHSGPYLNPYVFAEKLSENLKENDVVVCSNGSAFIITFQAAKTKLGQRWFFNSGCASMGYDLPAAVGACFGHDMKRVICMAGDGSIMMNLQELETIAYHKLPIKIFIYNNQGYLSIKQSQSSFFGNLVGVDSTNGVSFPNFIKLAEAFGIQGMILDKSNYEVGIQKALSTEGPFLCEVHVDPGQIFEPSMKSKKLPDGTLVSPPLEEMSPLLDEDELLRNMVIPLWEPDNASIRRKK